MNLTDHGEDKQNIEKNDKRIAFVKFIILSIFLVLFMLGTIITASVTHRRLFDEIVLINQQSFGLLSISLWLPFFLIFATIFVLGLYLNYITKYTTEMDSQISIFEEILKELHKPTHKKTKKITLIFWILLSLSFLIFALSQIFLYLGIAFLI
jgi:hypothetical protein